jgi:RNA polymerase sigma-70 factor, ECF subfamily
MVEELYSYRAPELRRYLLKMARDINEADDLLQETFLRALSNLNILQGLSPQKQRAWLYTTARRCLIDRRRSEKREYPTDAIGEGETNDDLTLPIVAEALGTLPEHLSTIIAMRYFAGMDSATIGRVLGIPAATVRTRLRAGIKRLKIWMSK